MVDGNGFIELMGQLHLDFLNTQKLFLNQTNIQIKLHKNSDNFCLLNNADGYKIQFLSVKAKKTSNYFK